jgi:hypothetical protein
MQDGLGPFLPSWSDTVSRVRTGKWPTAAKITIQINFSTVAENWKLEVSPEDTIADVKQQISDKHKIPFGDQILNTGTDDVIMTLKDNEKIKDSHIKQDDILKLKLREKTYPFTIYIQYNTGDPVPVGVSPDEILDGVRARIFDQDVALYNDAGNECAYNASVNGNGIKNGDFLYAQDEKAKKDIPNQEIAVQRREANARHGRSRPATPPVPSRPRTPPPDPENRTFRPSR